MLIVQFPMISQVRLPMHMVLEIMYQTRQAAIAWSVSGLLWSIFRTLAPCTSILFLLHAVLFLKMYIKVTQILVPLIFSYFLLSVLLFLFFVFCFYLTQAWGRDGLHYLTCFLA